MKIALVGTEFEENLSLRYLAAASLQAGHATRIVHYASQEDLEMVVPVLLAGGYHYIGLSIAFQHHACDFIALARALRAAGFAGHLGCGGHLPTAAWSQLLADVPEIDSIIRHDGELTLVELLAALERGEAWRSIQGVCARELDGTPAAAPARPQPADLDELPFPLRDRAHAVHVGLRFAPLVGSRGCYGNCNYCCITSWHRTSKGRRFRLRSPASVADEMSYLFHDREVRIYCFHDDTMFLPRERDTIQRLEQLRVELSLRRVGRVALVGKCRPDSITPAVLRAARDCGVVRLYLGIENGSEAGLRNLNRRHDLQSCRRALRLLREARIFACFNILLFEPDSCLRDLQDNLVFLEEYPDFPFNFCRAEVYCGSSYEERLRAAGRLHGSYLGYTYEIADPRVELAFRICAVAFRTRNFTVDGVANMASGMGYEAALLRHFHAPAGLALAEAIEALGGEVGRGTLQHLRRVMSFAEAADLGDARGATDFTEELASTINFGDLEVRRRQEQLREEVKRFADQHSETAMDATEDVAAVMQGGA